MLFCRGSVSELCVSARIFFLFPFAAAAAAQLEKLTGNPYVLDADVRHPLVLVPVRLLWQCFVDDIVKVKVVREDDMSSYVVEEAFRCDVCAG